jgi:sn-glycerol 3-phosphate transport system permease protein
MRGDSGLEPFRRSLLGRYALLIALAFAVLLPIYVTVVGAFTPGEKVLRYPGSLWPSELTLEGVRSAWSSGNLGRYLVNSAVMATLITVLQVVTSVLAAYAFAFLWFPAKRLVFALFLATLTIPAEATIVANVETIQRLGWTDSYQGLVVPFAATAFGTFLLRQVFLQLPRDLSDAAAMDGVGHLRFLWDVAAPLARPTIGALATFSFLSAWNQYLWPLLVTTQDEYRTVQIGLKFLSGANVSRFNVVMAGNVIAAAPIFIILLVFQRQLIRGLTAGAVKG